MASKDNEDLIDQVVTIYSYVLYTAICQIINVFGIVTNIINIVCFCRQGFDDSVNISLLGLSISDFGNLVTITWTALFITPAFLAADLPFDPIETCYLTSVMMHFSFTRISSCTTAMITIERCLCITAPLQIKRIITPKRVAIVYVCVFIVFFCSGSPVWIVNRLEFKYFPLKNKTLFGIISTADRENVEMITFAINNFFIPFCCFMIIVVCTTILSVKLRSQSKWRQETITSSHINRISNRNQKAAKMVVIIAILFIICYVPLAIIVLAAGLVPELSINRKYTYISLFLAGIGYILESVNSSMNIFIYYRMSSKYKRIVCAIFSKCAGQRKL